ncbi:MAG: hypothetical protein H6R21_2717, partial [Proteobacteria bacterium]|nr:hypothetical protein [Pseudomonadota bacterium]
MRGEITRFNPLSPTLSLWEREEKACALFDGLISNSIGSSVAPHVFTQVRNAGFQRLLNPIR